MRDLCSKIPCYPCVASVIVVCVSACACSLFCLFRNKTPSLVPVMGGESPIRVRHEVWFYKEKKNPAFVSQNNCGCYKI